MDIITYWNDVALEANRVAHTNPHPTEAAARGPAGSSRAFAIIHLAMHDAYFGIVPAAHGTYLTGLPAPAPMANVSAAVSAAAHATMSALYPNQKAALELAHAGAPGLTGKGLDAGHDFGASVAAAMLASRAGDPGTGDDGYSSSIAPGAHRQDPANPTQGYHAPFYGARSKCFAVTHRHTLLAPPDLATLAYDEAVAEVRAKGIAPGLVGTLPAGAPARTPEETAIALFWAYDGAKGLGTPPRLYNQIVRQVAEAKLNDVTANARLFALVNAAMGDAGILAWDEKYLHDLWRPVIGIREHDASMGPSGIADNGLDPDGDPFWLPLGAPRTNERAPSFTPPFPAYPSGHATFGAAALQATRLFFGVATNGPDTLFDGLGFVSEELDGVSTDEDGVVRPRHVRSFPGGLWQMMEENGRSRVYLGVHWVFDAFAVDAGGDMDLNVDVGGLPLGLAIADDIAANGLDESAAAGPRLP